MWFRVDNRLVHGQVIEAWLPYVNAKHLIVANDALAADVLRQQIVELAVPQRITVHFIPVKRLPALLEVCGDDSFVLFADCNDARRAAEYGVAIPVLNVGNLHYGPHKTQLLPHIALSEQDRSDLRFLQSRLTQLDYRCVPAENVRGCHDLKL